MSDANDVPNVAPEVMSRRMSRRRAAGLLLASVALAVAPGALAAAETRDDEAERTVANFDRIEAPRDFDHRRGAARIAEVAREALGVDPPSGVRLARAVAAAGGDSRRLAAALQ